MTPQSTRVPGKTLSIFIPEDLMKQIEDFRFKERAESRVQAIRMLLSLALGNKKKEGK